MFVIPKVKLFSKWYNALRFKMIRNFYMASEGNRGILISLISNSTIRVNIKQKSHVKIKKIKYYERLNI